MSPIRDSSFSLFTTSDALVFNGADKTGYGGSTGYEIDGTGPNGMAVHLILPTIDSTLSSTIALSVLIRASSTSTITSVSGTYPIIASRHDITAVGEYIIPFITNKRTVSFDFVMESASGAYNNPVAWVTLNVSHDWDRVGEWH